MRMSRASGLMAVSLLLAATACMPDPLPPPVPLVASPGVLVASPEPAMDTSAPSLQLVHYMPELVQVAMPAPSLAREVIAFRPSVLTQRIETRHDRPESAGTLRRMRPPSALNTTMNTAPQYSLRE